MTRIVTTHVTISAPTENVWETLTDLDGYRTWNPFITAAPGTMNLGKRLQLTVQPPGGQAMTFRPWVTPRTSPLHEWLGRLGLPGVFDGRHSFTLTPMMGGRTLIQQ